MARLDLPLEQMFTYMPVSHCRDMVAVRRTSDTISIFLCVFEWHVVISHPALHFHILVHIFTPKVRMCTRICTQMWASLGEFRRVFGEFRRVFGEFWRVIGE